MAEPGRPQELPLATARTADARHTGAIRQARKEAEWLPRLAPHLPLAVPVPVAVGEPDFGYPWPWAVTRWLDGEVATVEALADSPGAALEIAEFLIALQRFAPCDVPADNTIDDLHDDLRGRPLVDRDRATRAAIVEVHGVFDAPAMTALWYAALSAPAWARPPVWFHGDFHTGNLLTNGGRLSAVIDFGGLGIGDPACDLMVAFTLMSRGAGPPSAPRSTWTTPPGCGAAAGPWPPA